jgi:hypothetical protein
MKTIENSSVVAVAGDGRPHHTISQTQNQQPSSCTPENELVILLKLKSIM